MVSQHHSLDRDLCGDVISLMAWFGILALLAPGLDEGPRRRTIAALLRGWRALVSVFRPLHATELDS